MTQVTSQGNTLSATLNEQKKVLKKIKTNKRKAEYALSGSVGGGGCGERV
jgi:hypothetical protein